MALLRRMYQYQSTSVADAPAADSNRGQASSDDAHVIDKVMALTESTFFSSISYLPEEFEKVKKNSIYVMKSCKLIYTIQM